MLTLAEGLQGVGDVTFVTSSDAVVRRKLGASYRVESAADGYEAALARLFPLDAVVIDRLHVAPPLARWVRRSSGARLVIFGNVSSANRYAHVVINAIVGTRFANERRVDGDTGTLYLEGPRYVLLGKEFREGRGTHVQRDPLRRILLQFGGSDQANLTCLALRTLWNWSSALDITACVGAAYPYESELTGLAARTESHGHNLRVLRDSDSMFRLMCESDLVFTSPGGTLFEAMVTGVPVLGFYQNQRQEEMFGGFPFTYRKEILGDLPALAQRVRERRQATRPLAQELAVAMGHEEIIAEIVSSGTAS
jgi:UDP-2,4-diacetamido-2,4,6-trideoxy-beta-L-altropyranose hydrolase